MQPGTLVAACIVVLQATAVFLGRGGWSFLMAKATPEAAEWQTAMSLIHDAPDQRPPPMNSWFVNYLENATHGNGSLVYCLQSTYMRSAYCLQHAHAPHAPEAVMDTWNPHVLLLALACLHMHITLGPDAPIYIAPLLLILVIVAAVTEGLRDADLMRYPTIVTLLVGALAGAWFTCSAQRDDRWRVAAHLQIVCVPLAVLGISVAGGGRLWCDALGYFALLSAAVNCLWAQSTLRSAPALGLCRAFTIALTLLTLRIANDGFGAYDMWRYVIAYVACAGLAPIVLLSLFPADDSYLYFYQNYYYYVIKAAPNGVQTYDYHHVLLQVCAALALLGLSSNLAFINIASSH